MKRVTIYNLLAPFTLNLALYSAPSSTEDYRKVNRYFFLCGCRLPGDIEHALDYDGGNQSFPKFKSSRRNTVHWAGFMGRLSPFFYPRGYAFWRFPALRELPSCCSCFWPISLFLVWGYPFCAWTSFAAPSAGGKQATCWFLSPLTTVPTQWQRRPF